MNRIDDLNVVAARDLAQGVADAGEAGTKTFAPVPGDEQDALSGVEPGKGPIEALLWRARRCDVACDLEQGVDDGIAGQNDAFTQIAFRQQGFARAGRRSIVARRHDGREAPVSLFGPRTFEVSFDLSWRRLAAHRARSGRTAPDSADVLVVRSNHREILARCGGIKFRH